MTLPGDQKIQRDDPSLTNVGLMEALVDHWLYFDPYVFLNSYAERRKSGVATLSPCEFAWLSFFAWITRPEGPELEAGQVTINTFHWLMRRRFTVLSCYGTLNYVGIHFGTPA
jgi:hypothetical protein